MVKSVGQKAKINNPEKGKRYGTIAELRAAVRAACIAEVNQRFAEERRGEVDGDVGERMEAYLRTIPRTLDQRPRQAWRELAAALVVAADVAKRSIAEREIPFAERPDSNEFAQRLELLFANASGPGLAEDEFNMFEFVDALKAQIDDEQATRGEALKQFRARLIERFDHPNLEWWARRDPSDRDLAILSLLAGSFPPKADAAQATKATRPTVARVIGEEVTLIAASRSRRTLAP